MAITSVDSLLGAAKQYISWARTGTRTTIAALPFTVFDIAGTPASGALAATNKVSGTVPVAGDAGYPSISTFGSDLGYLSWIEFSSSVASRFMLYDRLFVAGPFTIADCITLVTQPTYSGRIPNLEYANTELWVEAVTVGALNATVQIGYVNQAGIVSSTGVVATASLTIGRVVQVPLGSSDCGVQQVQFIKRTIATTGMINVMVLRPLWKGRVRTINDGDVHDFIRTGMPRIYDSSALWIALAADSTAIGLPMITMQVAKG